MTIAPERPADAPSKDAVALHLARAAEREGLGLCLWRHRLVHPDLAGFDVDAMIRARPWAEIERFLDRELAQIGWRALRFIKRGHLMNCLLAACGARPGNDEDFLQLDLYNTLSIRGVPIASAADLMARSHVDQGVRRLDIVDASTTTYLAKLILHGIPKARYMRCWREAFQRDPDRVRQLVVRAVGARLAKRLLTFEEIRTSGAVLRANQLRQALLRRPNELLRVVIFKLRDFAAAYRRPPGLMCVVCGPDGVGKSTMIGALEGVVVRRIVMGMRYFHTRPFLIPRLAKLVPMSRQRREALLHQRRRYEARIGLVISIVRLVITIVDYRVGYWLMIRPRLRRGELVIFDRYIQDYLVNPRLRGIALPTAILSTAARLVPQGDIHVYLVAKPQTLVERKGELSFSEAENEVNRYRKLAAVDPRGLLLDTETQGPSDLAKQVADALLSK